MSDATLFDTRKEWLEGRKAGIGGTDISAVLGLNPWKTPLDVFLGKTNAGDHNERRPSEAMFWGNALEPIIRQRYAEIAHASVCPPEFINELFPRSIAWDGQTLIEHERLPFVLGTPDGIVYEPGTSLATRGLEIKTAGFKGAEWGKEGTDEVPDHYRLQVAWYMAITGLEQWDIAALFSGNRLEIFRVQRDQELESMLLNSAVEFWEKHVTPRIPPRVDGTAAWSAHLAKKYAIGTQTFLEKVPEADTFAALLTDAQARIKAAEADERLAKNELATLIADNKGVKLADGGKVQWIRSRPETLTDWEAAFQVLAHRCQSAINQPDLDAVVAAHTTTKARTPYVRMYAAKEKP